ncbi:MAG: hypothetical protein GY754_17830 [bacterium]|nr:hypothetical protein [bacterium]
MKKSIVLICSFIILQILMFVNVTFVYANGNCDKPITIGGEIVPMKEFAYRKLQEISTGGTNYNVKFYNKLVGIFDKIYNNSSYDQFAPYCLKNCFNKMLLYKINNEKLARKRRKAFRNKMKSYGEVRFPRDVVFECELDPAIKKLNKELNVYLKKNNESSSWKRKRNEKLVKSIKDMLFDVMELREVINEYSEMRNVNSKMIEYNVSSNDLEKMDQLYMFLERCEYKITESSEVIEEAKTLYLKKYRVSHESSSESGIECDIFEMYTQFYRHPTRKVRVQELKNWMGIGSFYLNKFLNPDLMQMESYGINENENILSYFISQNPPVVYSVVTEKKFYLSYFNKYNLSYKTYYLPYDDNKALTMRLSDEAEFFMTDYFTGCSFQVFGSSSLPYVSHINAKNIGNSVGTGLEMCREKAGAMEIVMGNILETNKDTVKDVIRASGIVRVVNDFEKAGDNFADWDMSYYEYINENEVIAGKIYTLYYGLSCAVFGSRNESQWIFYALNRKLVGDISEAYEYEYELLQIWPVPMSVRRKLNEISENSGDEEINLMEQSESEN